MEKYLLIAFAVTVAARPEYSAATDQSSSLPAVIAAFCSAIHDNEGWLIDASGIDGDFFDTWEAAPAAIKRQMHVHNGYAFCRAWTSQRHLATKTLSKFVNR